LDNERYADDGGDAARAWERGRTVLAIGNWRASRWKDGALQICRQFSGQPGLRSFMQRRRLSAQYAGNRRCILAKLDSLLAAEVICLR